MLHSQNDEKIKYKIKLCNIIDLSKFILLRILFNKFTLLATVVLSKKDWLKFFKYVGYKGDYYFSGAKSLGLTK